jgi:cGMP-dependent protein kinase
MCFFLLIIQINHKWYHGFDWVALLKGTLTPPIVPELKSPEDPAYFAGDNTDDEPARPCPSWNPDLD